MSHYDESYMRVGAMLQISKVLPNTSNFGKFIYSVCFYTESGCHLVTPHFTSLCSTDIFTIFHSSVSPIDDKGDCLQIIKEAKFVILPFYDTEDMFIHLMNQFSTVYQCDFRFPKSDVSDGVIYHLSDENKWEVISPDIIQTLEHEMQVIKEKVEQCFSPADEAFVSLKNEYDKKGEMLWTLRRLFDKKMDIIENFSFGYLPY